MRFRKSWFQQDLLNVSQVSLKVFMDAFYKMGIPVKALESGEDPLLLAEIPEGRKDLHCLLGLAREAGAALQIPLKSFSYEISQEDQSSIFEHLDVDVPAESVLRYTVRLAAETEIGPSPLILQQRLRDLHIPSSNNVLDLAAWVFIETGQRLILRDLRDFPQGSFTIRDSFPGEILDEKFQDPLPQGIPVISDENFQALGLSGLQGPLSQDCRELIICCPCFCPQIQEVISPLLSDNTDFLSGSSDPMGTTLALDRFCCLYEKFHMGKILEGTLDNLNYIPNMRVLPDPIPQSILASLKILGFETLKEGTGIPSFRPDVISSQDLQREFSRVRRAIV